MNDASDTLSAAHPAHVNEATKNEHVDGDVLTAGDGLEIVAKLQHRALAKRGVGNRAHRAEAELDEQAADALSQANAALSAANARAEAAEARVEELTRERDEAFAANERDRSIIASARNAFNDAFQRRSWLLEGRGSYEWDDDRWRDEFAEAIKELSAPLDVLAKIGIDWSLCPVTPEEIAAARIDWKSRAETAEAQVKRLREAQDKAVPLLEAALLSADPYRHIRAAARALTKEGGNESA